MDEVDKQIIKLLKDDSRAGYGEIGSKSRIVRRRRAKKNQNPN